MKAQWYQVEIPRELQSIIKENAKIWWGMPYQKGTVKKGRRRGTAKWMTVGRRFYCRTPELVNQILATVKIIQEESIIYRIKHGTKPPDWIFSMADLPMKFNPHACKSLILQERFRLDFS